MSNLIGRPPTRESIIDEGNIPSLPLAKWLSSVTQVLRTATTTDYGLIKVAEDSVNTTTADATDLATAITLVNQLKTDVNDLKTKLRAAGVIA